MHLSLGDAKAFNSKTARQFVDSTPEYYPSQKNYLTIREYLVTHRVGVVTVDCWKRAFERLNSFGLLEARPPEPVPPVEPEPVEPAPQTEELIAGFDIETGEPRTYTQREIWKMSSIDYRKAFKLYLGKDGIDRTPTFRRSRYQ